jgi:ferredoxin
VAAGADLLAAPEDEELDILDVLGAPKTHRLACCLKLKAGPGLVVLKPVNDY